MLHAGRLFDTFLVVYTVGFFLFFIWRKNQGKIESIRLIAAVEAMPEAVGRSVEMGRPVHFTPGYSAVTSSFAVAMSLASMEIYRYICELSAEKGARLITSLPEGGNPQSIALMEEISEFAYKKAGKMELYKREDLIHHGTDLRVCMASIANLIEKENVASNIAAGIFFGLDSAVILEKGNVVGALQIGGTPRWIVQYSCAMGTDYMLICEELYAAAAQLSGNQDQLQSLAGEDYQKLLAIFLTIIGGVLSTLGWPIIQNLMAM